MEDKKLYELEQLIEAAKGGGEGQEKAMSVLMNNPLSLALTMAGAIEDEMWAEALQILAILNIKLVERALPGSRIQSLTTTAPNKLPMGQGGDA